MSDETRLVAPQVAAAYDFSQFHTLVDVGGGAGLQLATVLRAFPQLEGTLFELPHVAAVAQKALSGEAVADRCQVVAGDFFATVPSGADAYLLKRVLHDWSDEDAIRILRSCRQAMGPTSKLLVVEIIIGFGNQLFPYGERLDLLMQVLFGSQERTLAEYEGLFSQAGHCLSATVPTAGAHGIVEAIPIDTP